jgi:2-methylcitrate dehydratase PrpD
MTEASRSDGPLIAQLARHLQRPVPEYVRTRARLHLLDWLACVAGARGWARENGFQGRWTWDDLCVIAGNVLEMDDVHRGALLHPGPVVWGVAIGRNAPRDIPMYGILDGAVIGYEAMIAVGATFDAHHYSHYHPTSTSGSFGAAATWAHNWLDDTQLANALAMAASVAGGVWQTRHSANYGKQWHVLNARDMGLRTAFNADAGLTGPLDVLEGLQGLYAATCRDPKPMVLDPDWRIEEVSFKPWAACRHAHPAIDCALELRAGGKLTAPFHVETYADAITFCDKPDPTTETEAKFSLQHAVAVIADGRNATPADFTPEAIAALAPLRAQVTVAEDPAITARYPAHFGARVNGLELQDCRGDPERPVTEADIVAKMHMLAEWGGLPAAEADRAARLALHGNDAGAIVTMLEEWLS